MKLLALALGTLVGVSLGLLGGGGSILAIPILVYVAGLEPAIAIPMSLVMVAAASSWAARDHHRAGRVNLGLAGTFGAVGSLGALLGSQFTGLLAPRSLMMVFAALMIAVGAMMTRRREPRLASEGHSLLLAIPVALTVGVLTGFLGVGGGFLIVPALVLVMGLSTPDAVGTSLVVIALNATAAVVGQLRNVSIPLLDTVLWTILTMAGATAGHRLGAGWPAPRVRRVFGLFVVAVGVATLAAELR